MAPYSIKEFITGRHIAALILPAAAVSAGMAFFGVQFSLSLLPLAVTAAFAYPMHVRLISRRSEQISRTSRIHLATVEALATAIDAQDQVGIGHVRRTQIYAVGIGKAMGLPERELDALRMAALLHDIGKLAVPDHILNKPGQLTPAELEKTKIHTLVGASILENIEFDCPVVPAVKYHHEWWNGKGYPEGLKGDEIPLTARILCVADAFDKLRAARPFRPAMDRERARRIMEEERESRFDPAIVDVMMRNLSLFESEIARNGLSYSNSTAVGAPKTDKHYIEQIKLANREVFSLYELAREFSSSASLQDAVGMFADKLRELVPFDTFALYLLDESHRVATAAHVQGAHADLLTARQIKVGQGATGYALKSGEPVYNVDPDLDFSYSGLELTRQYMTMASVPLIPDGNLVGAVTIYASELETYGEEHIRLFETISRFAADAIGKILQHDEAKTHALTDPMTNLPNARSLQLQFDKEVARASRGGSSFQLLMLDLDGFKAVNDNFGHKAGDEMLREIGKVIREQLRDYDFLARYGGDEFVALIPETTPDDVLDLCNRIENAVRSFELPVDGGKKASVGVSLGASGYPKNGETFDQMIVAADKAMYLRKSIRKRFGAGSGPKSAKDVVADGVSVPMNDNLIVELDETHVLLAAG